MNDSLGQRLQQDFADFYGNKAAFKPLVVAAGAGTAAVFLLQLQPKDAISYGSVCAVGASVMDGVLIAVGTDAKINKALDSVSGYINPLDFVGGGLGGLGLFYLTGVRGRSLWMAAGIGAVASGVGPKVADWMVSQLMAAKLRAGFKNLATPSQAAQGQ